MSSPADVRRAAVLLAAGFGCVPACPQNLPATPQTTVPVIAPQRAAIEDGVTALSEDPKLGHSVTTRHLQWDKSAATPQPTPQKPLDWLVEFFQFINGAASVVIWVAGAIAAGFMAIWIWRLLQTRQVVQRLPVHHRATQVQDLDIRPATLPDDVGAAALALARAGDTRAALSLLYRGALSRAVHRFAVGIDEAFTESDVLRTVTSRLDTSRSSYFATLLRVWQRRVYGGLEPADDELASLCAGFAGTFDAEVA